MFTSFSGIATTQKAIQAFIAILTNHPELQNKLQMEVDSTLEGREPRLSDMHKIPLLEAVSLFHICPGLCFQNFYRPQTKFAKVMFLHVSVSHSVHRGGGIPACIAGLQAHTQGEVEGSGLGSLQAHTQGEVEGLARGVSRPTSGGVSPGPHPGRGSPGPHPGGVGGVPACTEADTSPQQQTATAAGGTHPTGMHSSWKCSSGSRISQGGPQL